MKIKVTVQKRTPVPIKIHTETIALDAFLKLANAVESGGQAKVEIQRGSVRVNGTVCAQRGKKLALGDSVRFSGETYEVVRERKETI
jgi:ribosome-associated protein